jgi:hypothetical protein
MSDDVHLCCTHISNLTPHNTVAVVRDNKLALYIMQKGGSKVPLTSAEIQILMTHAGRSLTHYMMPK